MTNIRKDLLYKEECYQIIGACMAVHRELGCGFLETVYQEALSIEFDKQMIPYEKEKIWYITYNGVQLKQCYKTDFICYDKIVLELKATKALCPEHQAQIINYLKVTGLRMGLLINFGATSLQYERFLM